MSPWVWALITILTILVCCVGLVVWATRPDSEDRGIIADRPSTTVNPDRSLEPSSEWETIYELSGTNDYREAELFELNTDRVRVLYEVTSTNDASEAVVFTIYLLPEDWNLDERGGLPAVFETEAGDGRARVDGHSGMGHLNDGSYYLEIGGANCRWTIKVQEQR